MGQTRGTAYDPGGHSGDLSSYMSLQQRRDAIAAIERARDQASRALTAEATGNDTEGKRLWKIALGNSLPTA